MWRGWHKLPGGDDHFNTLANIPSSFPKSSPSGTIAISGSTGDQLFAVVVDETVSTSYCMSIINTAESKGFEVALLNQGEAQQEEGVILTNIRSSHRCIVDDSEMADYLWSILQQYLPPPSIVPGKRYKGWRATGVNPRFRVLRYSAGERFELHQDGSYRIEAECNEKDGSATLSQQSFMTLQLYLNDGGGVSFAGGATRFVEPLSMLNSCVNSEEVAKVRDVVPKSGRLLLFQHNCWHEGERVTSGVKYVLRSEVMFTKEF
jgi:hypothetical protein